jgi:hypothetical protein
LREDLLLLRLWRFFAEKRRCSAAETESAFAEGKYVGRGAARLKQGEVSPSADGDKGYAPLTAPPFEKGGRKLFVFCDDVTENRVCCVI